MLRLRIGELVQPIIKHSKAINPPPPDLESEHLERSAPCVQTWQSITYLVSHFFDQVIVIQACQQSEPGARHIVLKRPHAVLLHATVPDGVAYRGAYIGALADQIGKITNGEEKDITGLHTEAVQAMKSTSARQQVPMIQSTLEKFLILDWVGVTSRQNNSN